jgi:hypothetical protein
MPEYRSPGVYIEEVATGAVPIQGVGTSTAGFLGLTERGPTTPELVTSFAEFRRTYGAAAEWTYGEGDDAVEESSFLVYAIDGFFKNGGGRCYVARIVARDATAASTTLDEAVTVTAIGDGLWGNDVTVDVGTGTLSADLFSLTVRYGDYEETYADLSADPTDGNYYEKVVNGSSTLVELSRAGEGTPAVASGVALEGGAAGAEAVGLDDFQGRDTPGERTGLAAFEEIDDIQIVCAPDEVNATDYAGLTGELRTHCENMGDRFAVLQGERGVDIDGLRPPVDSDYAAYYVPWIEVIDPETNAPVLVPPGGHVAGIYARSDTERGVHKAPANEIVRGAQELQLNITKEEQEGLNPVGVNVIRSFPGRGIRVWGARTTSSDALWKYLNVRRLFLYVEESIEEGTQWAVFEPNDQRLWARVRQSVSNFLTSVWRDGALMGTTPEEAFYVTCDRTTMTQDDIDNGRLIVEIGIAPVKPAEFVIFRITQTAGGSE